MSERDPGLQPERTRLAWGRSELGFIAITLLLVKLGAVSALQLATIVVLLRLLLGAAAARERELAGTPQAVNRRTMMRHLWLSLSVVLAAVWFLLH